MVVCSFLAAPATAQSAADAERIQQLRVSAAGGDPEAQFQLSSELSGTGDDGQRPEADKWLRAAAERGHLQAQYQLAMSLQENCRKAANHACPEAIVLLQRAADQGLVKAGYFLGIDYHQGFYVQQDAVRSFYEFQRAAQAGHAGAAKELGVAYRDGDVVSVDLVESYKWFAFACHRWGLGGAVEGQRAYWRNRDEAAARITSAERMEAQSAVHKMLDDLAPRPLPEPGWTLGVFPPPPQPDPCDGF